MNNYILTYTIEDQYFCAMIRGDNDIHAGNKAFVHLVSEIERYKSMRFHSFYAIADYGLAEVRLHELLGFPSRAGMQAGLGYFNPIDKPSKS